jgi:hypothetical protein
VIIQQQQTNHMSCNQREKSCGSCPFSKTSKPGGLGGSPIQVYLGQIIGPFFLPCHAQKEYKGNDTGIQSEQCAGAAVFRANLGIADRMPDMLLHLEAGSDPNVFETMPEFIKHHVPDATPYKVSAMMALLPEFLSDELRKAQAKGRVYPNAKR